MQRVFMFANLKGKNTTFVNLIDAFNLLNFTNRNAKEC